MQVLIKPLVPQVDKKNCADFDERDSILINEKIKVYIWERERGRELENWVARARDDGYVHIYISLGNVTS